MQNTPMHSDKLISIVSPLFNCELFLDEMILSVLEQTHSNWELILVDDKSMDKSLDIAGKYNDPRIILLTHSQNQGVASARNTAINYATGSYIAFLDSDDVWEKNKLEVQLNFMTQNNSAVSHTAYRKINHLGKVLDAHVQVSKSVNYKKLLTHNEIGMSTAMFNSNVIGKPTFIKTGHEDYAFWLSILKDNHISYGINEVMVSYRFHSNSISFNKIKAAKYTWGIFRNVEHLPLLVSMYFFGVYALKAGTKYLKTLISN